MKRLYVSVGRRDIEKELYKLFDDFLVIYPKVNIKCERGSNNLFRITIQSKVNLIKNLIMTQTNVIIISHDLAKDYFEGTGFPGEKWFSYPAKQHKRHITRGAG